MLKGFTFCLAAVATALVACERRQTPVAAPVSQPAAAPGVEVSPITPLQPHQTTHLAVDTLGNIYWVQESDAGQDVMFVIGQGEVPRATQLTSTEILAAARASGGTGNIQSLLGLNDGSILFYFAGGKGRDVVCALGRFQPRESKITILADTDGLSEATGMRAALDLARGTLVAGEARPWLWVRHSDAAILLRFDVGGAGGAGVQLSRPFAAIKSPAGPIVPTHDAHALAAGPDDSLLLLDLPAAAVWKISSAGEASKAVSLIRFPSMLSEPLFDPEKGLVLFASDSERIMPASLEQVDDPAVDTQYPAFLMFGEQQAVRDIPLGHIYGSGGLPVDRMQLRRLVPERRPGSYVAYDAASGNLVRVRFVARR